MSVILTIGAAKTDVNNKARVAIIRTALVMYVVEVFIVAVNKGNLEFLKYCLPPNIKKYRSVSYSIFLYGLRKFLHTKSSDQLHTIHYEMKMQE